MRVGRHRVGAGFDGSVARLYLGEGRPRQKVAAQCPGRLSPRLVERADGLPAKGSFAEGAALGEKLAFGRFDNLEHADLARWAGEPVTTVAPAFEAARPARTKSARIWETKLWGTSVSAMTSRILRVAPTSKARASEIAERIT